HAVRAAPTSGGPLWEASFAVDPEEGVVAIDRSGWKSPRRGRLLALLARYGLAERRQSILQEAIDSLVDMDYAYDQASTLTELAPLLNEPFVSNLLDRLRQLQADSLRLDVLAIALGRLADLESPDAARNEAHRIWGESVPVPVMSV